MSRNINEILNSEEELYRAIKDSSSSSIRCACPGIIQSFDATTQICTVQLAIREHVTNSDHTKSWVDLPLLLDVPIVFPQCSSFALTFPISKGDECLVVFGDMCIDGWFSRGGVQNQLEKRRHSLSDGFAIVGVKSQPNVISNYSTDSVELRNKEKTQYIEIKENAINIVGNVTINGKAY
jgi:hypothetical protein